MSPRANETWSSDASEAVDRLVEACSRPRASLEAPSAPHLIGRELTPYFGSSEPLADASPAQGKQPSSTKRKNSSPQHASGRPRSGAVSSPSVPVPATKSSGKKQQQPSSGSGSDDERTFTFARSPTATTTHNKAARHQSPPSSGVTMLASSPLSTPWQCPGQFRASPKPDALPVPSSSLLLRAISAHHVATPRLAVVA